MVDWGRAFTNSNANDMVGECIKAIQSILSNFISHQTVTIDDKYPTWFN